MLSSTVTSYIRKDLRWEEKSFETLNFNDWIKHISVSTVREVS